MANKDKNNSAFVPFMAAYSSEFFCSFYNALNISSPKKQVALLESSIILKIGQDGGENISVYQNRKVTTFIYCKTGNVNGPGLAGPRLGVPPQSNVRYIAGLLRTPQIRNRFQ